MYFINLSKSLKLFYGGHFHFLTMRYFTIPRYLQMDTLVEKHSFDKLKMKKKGSTHGDVTSKNPQCNIDEPNSFSLSSKRISEVEVSTPKKRKSTDTLERSPKKRPHLSINPFTISNKRAESSSSNDSSLTAKHSTSTLQNVDDDKVDSLSEATESNRVKLSDLRPRATVFTNQSGLTSHQVTVVNSEMEENIDWISKPRRSKDTSNCQRNNGHDDVMNKFIESFKDCISVTVDQSLCRRPLRSVENTVDASAQKNFKKFKKVGVTLIWTFL